jgi:hypothetical protein
MWLTQHNGMDNIKLISNTLESRFTLLTNLFWDNFKIHFSEFLKTTCMKISSISWDVITCTLVKYWHFWGTCCPCLQKKWRSSETLVLIYHTAWHQIPSEINFQSAEWQYPIHTSLNHLKLCVFGTNQDRSYYLLLFQCTGIPALCLIVWFNLQMTGMAFKFQCMVEVKHIFWSEKALILK